ncbi:MAG: NAD(P)/FAD-dependent oxidoreductase [Cyclobacteriaceae bacterium]
MKIDYLLIGQGVAGSALATHLIEAGAKIKVLDMNKQHTASWAAAGLYNPITGRQMVKTWLADELFPYLQRYYRHAENISGTRFLHPKPIYRPFVSMEEQNDWLAKADNNAFSEFVEKVHVKPHYDEMISNSYGGLLLKQSGYLDLPAYIAGIRRWLQEQDVYEERQFEAARLKIHDSSVEYDDIRAEKIIFCDGPDASSQPFFSWLPFQLVKGEVLTIRPERDFEVVFNRGIFILPADGQYKVGSTYNHHDLTFTPTQQGRNYLEEKMRKFCKFRYTVSGHIAGVRPATQDRKPFIGLHPVQKPLAIFNGLGTKGVSLAPYFARQFSSHLMREKSLDDAVDVKRFYHKYHSV